MSGDQLQHVKDYLLHSIKQDLEDITDGALETIGQAAEVRLLPAQESMTAVVSTWPAAFCSNFRMIMCRVQLLTYRKLGSNSYGELEN